MIHIRKILGVRGINRRENPHLILWANLFDILLVTILIWLPIQWYLQSHAKLTLSFILTIDWLVWAVFVTEAVTFVTQIKDKWEYIKGNWLNFVIILFAFPVFWDHSSAYMAIFRSLRLLIIIRLASVQLHFVYRILRQNKFGTTLLAFLTITLLSGILASYIDPSLGTPWDGIWWAWETVTTVGYGDIVPHTFFGKIFAGFLMLMGVGLISVVAANFAAFFLGGTHQQKMLIEIKKELETISARLDQLEK